MKIPTCEILVGDCLERLRSVTLIEINPEYAAIARQWTAVTPGMF